MSRVNDLIEEIKNKIEQYRREPDRNGFIDLGGVAIFRINDDLKAAELPPITDPELKEIYEYFLKGDYGFKIENGWLKTKDRLISLDSVAQIYVSLAYASTKVYELRATLKTFSTRYSKNQGTENKSEQTEHMQINSDTVTLTCIDMPRSVAYFLFEATAIRLQS